MSANISIRGVVVLASLALFLLMFAPAVGAADQPMGSETQSPQGIGTQPMKDQSQIQRDVQVSGELGKGHEQQMKVPEWLKITPEDDYSHLLNLDFKGQPDDIVKQTREDDALSTGF
jgi:hypothetical protein